jgi:excisionase family DNA binding protein
MLRKHQEHSEGETEFMGVLMAEERELTLTQVAARLGVTVETVRPLLQDGTIPSRKQGRQWRVLESDVERYIEATRKRERRQ